MSAFDYGAPAELFLSNSFSRNACLQYRRFASAAQAIQFVVESSGTGVQTGTVLEVDEERFDMKEIHRLYAAPGYPFERKAVDAPLAAPAGAKAGRSAPASGAPAGMRGDSRRRQRGIRT